MLEIQETWVRSLGPEDPLEKEIATHSRILAWEILWTEEPDGLQSIGSQKSRHHWVTEHAHPHMHQFIRKDTTQEQASPVAQMVKHLPAMWETWVRSLGWEDPLEKEMATHSTIFVWKIPWKEEPGKLQSMGSQRVGHNWATSLSLWKLIRNSRNCWI